MTIGMEGVARMGWLRRWQLRRAARQYARRLGPHLQRAYGAAEHYTAPQIRASVSKLGLNTQFTAIGYAAFLTEDTFASLGAEMPVYIPYDEARELVARFRPTHLIGASSYYESWFGGVGGPGDSGHGGSP